MERYTKLWKIKDNVDLKELENFRFDYNELLDEYVIDIATDRRGACVELAIRRRYLKLDFIGDDTGGSGEDYLDNVIYDLIKADLIEKVEDNENN